MNNFCRAQNPPIQFIRGDIHGLFGSVFVDFGDTFVVADPTGEQPHSAIIRDIAKDAPCTVTCVDEDRIEFEDGDLVIFSEVKGMTQLNDGVPRPVTVKGPYSFSIPDTSGFDEYVSGGIVVQVKQPKTLSFKCLSDSIASPGEFLESDFAKFGRSYILHLAFQAMEEYRKRNGGNMPAAASKADAAAFVALAKELAPSTCGGVDVGKDEEVILRQYSLGATAALNPMAAIFGGIIGQEVVKAATAKFHPIHQWFYLDALECLPEGYDGMPEEEFAPCGDRYDGQRAVFGRTFQEKMAAQNFFLVGAGALGCEFMKNFAMMGLACGKDGMVTVTDDDIIEKSNLSRQFLFRNR